jgi:hypothetical protein
MLKLLVLVHDLVFSDFGYLVDSVEQVLLKLSDLLGLLLQFEDLFLESAPSLYHGELFLVHRAL